MSKFPAELSALCFDNPWLTHETTIVCERASEVRRSISILATAFNGHSSAAAFHAGANPNLSPRHRLKLASSTEWNTEPGRLGLVVNPASEQPELDLLSDSDDNRVRLGITRYVGHRLSPGALDRLSRDHTVSDEFAQVQNLPEWAYRNLINQKMTGSIWNLRTLAENPSAPPDFLEGMVSGADNYDFSFPAQAISNPSTPIGAILEVPANLHVKPVQEAVDGRRREAEEWLLTERGFEVDLDNVPLEWVREIISPASIS